MILTNKQALTMLLSYVNNTIRFAKTQNVRAEDLVVEGLQILLKHDESVTLDVRNTVAAKFILASEQGSATGLFLEGLVRKEGFGCKQDIELGNAAIVMAAKGRKNLIALHFVGVNLINTKKAHGLEYLDYAAALGFEESALTLALAYLYRPDIAAISYKKALTYLQSSGRAGQPLLEKVIAHVCQLQAKKFALTNKLEPLARVAQVATLVY